jgi:hypothetical protein
VKPVQTQAFGLTLNWDVPLSNQDGSTPAMVDSYEIYRSVDGGGTFTLFQTLPKTILTTSDTDVPTGTICYEARAANLKGEGPASNRLCFQVPNAKPSAPSNLR